MHAGAQRGFWLVSLCSVVRTSEAAATEQGLEEGHRERDAEGRLAACPGSV